MKWFRNLAGLLIISTIIILSVSCNSSGKPGSRKSLGEDTVKYVVTFVELGSVRCIPCREMQPIMKSIEEKYGDRVKVEFHDVWTEAGAPFAKKYGIEAIPTQVFLDRYGEEFFRHEGYFPEEEVIKVLNTKGII